MSIFWDVRSYNIDIEHLPGEWLRHCVTTVLIWSYGVQHGIKIILKQWTKHPRIYSLKTGCQWNSCSSAFASNRMLFLHVNVFVIVQIRPIFNYTITFLGVVFLDFSQASVVNWYAIALNDSTDRFHVHLRLLLCSNYESEAAEYVFIEENINCDVVMNHLVPRLFRQNWIYCVITVGVHLRS